ncbi:MAG TPA: chorismate-binding protein [Polyangiaceae bacterium]|nr:chorismate-binding protein [Polyangiaceae bacterium]
MSDVAATFGRAAHLVRWLQQGGGPEPGTAYLLHRPDEGAAVVGVGASRVVRYERGELCVGGPGGPPRRGRCAERDVFAAAREALLPGLPAFFVASLDLHRSARDPGLPLLALVQPAAEIDVAGDRVAVRVFREADLAGAPGVEALRRALAAPPPPPAPAPPRPFGRDEAAAYLGAWQGDSDEAFRARIGEVRAALAGRDTKAFPVRHHRRALAPHGRDVLSLYELYAASEPACVASHYFRLGALQSVGCSPENVFELEGDALALDVVSGTGPRSDDAERDGQLADQLTASVKELREHLLAIEQCLKKAPAFCAPGSLALRRRFEIKHLARVRHLHSRVTGRLLPGLDWLDLLERYYPSMDAYEADLKGVADAMTHPHRFYGGVFGRLSEDGARAGCYQTLRSCLVDGDEMYLAAGVGVTRLSDPEAEVRESHAKLAGLLGALAAWEGAAPPPEPAP